MVMLAALLRRYVEGDQEGFRVRTLELRLWTLLCCLAARSGRAATHRLAHAICPPPATPQHCLLIARQPFVPFTTSCYAATCCLNFADVGNKTCVGTWM